MKNKSFITNLIIAIVFCFVHMTQLTEQAKAETIHACFQQNKGSLRVVNVPNECLSSEIPITLGGSKIKPTELFVNCEAGEKVADALAQTPKIGRVTITVNGVCEESVEISRDDVTLQGTSQGDGLSCPSGNWFALSINGGRRVQLYNLSLIGGDHGLMATGGASFEAYNLSVSNTSNAGVTVGMGASGTISGSNVTDCSRGIVTDLGGSIIISGSQITNSTLWGVQGNNIEMNSGSIVRNSGWDGVFGGDITLNNVIIENNQGVGAFVIEGTLDISGSGTLIRANNSGVGAMSGGNVDLRDGARVTENLGSGVFAGVGSTIKLRNAIIEGNLGNGLNLGGGSSAYLEEGNIIRGNGSDGIFLGDISVAAFYGGTNQISENGRYGIYCMPAPSVAQISGDVGTVSGNNAGQINCPQNP